MSGSNLQVRVRFVTDFDQFRIVDSPFAVPNKLGRHGLSEVINHLLELATSQPFDFLIQGKLVRVPLHKFIVNNRLSTEEIITIEYFPAASLSDESENIDAPSWVGSIASSAVIVATGCYNGQVKLFDVDKLNEVGSIEAHEDPIRAVLAWGSQSENASSKSKGKSAAQYHTIATASKDQSVKLWGSSSASDNYHLIATLQGHVTSVESMSRWESKDSLLSGDWAGNLFAWEVQPVIHAASSGSATTVGSGAGAKKKRKNSEGDVTATFTASDMKPVFSIKAHGQSISGISSVDSNNTVLTCSWDHSLKAWDLERQDCIATMACSKVFTSLDVCTAQNGDHAVTHNSAAILTSHPDGKARLWDLRVGQETSSSKASYGKSAQWISQVRWMTSSAHMFATTDYSGSLTLWDTRSPAVPLGRTEAHNGKALCLHWLRSPDKNGADIEQRLLTGGSDCCVKSTNVGTAVGGSEMEGDE